jgi:hypothetical protein
MAAVEPLGATPTYGFPYPELDDPANVPLDMQELANAVDAALAGEANARGNAVAGEANARQQADAALGGRIDGETAARQNADNAHDNRLNALEARARAVGGATVIHFDTGAARIPYPAGTNAAATLGATVCNADPATANAWFSAVGWDANGINVYGWNSDNTPLHNRDLKIAWTAVVT